MKVSICIPAYKKPEGIRRLLNSILIQDYKDYDVVITDDTPGDEVEAVANEFISNGMTNLRYVKNENRLGPSDNWNHSINISTGEYVKIMHHDDWFSGADSLGKFVKMLDENENSVFAFSGTHQVDLETNDSYTRCISDEDMLLITKDWRNIFLGNVIGAPSAIIFRRTTEQYEKRLTWVMDMEFMMRLLQKAEKEGHNTPAFTGTKEPLITIGMSDTQLTESVRDSGDINVYEFGFLMDEFGLSSDPKYREWLIKIALRSDKPYDSIKDYGIPKDEYTSLLKKKKQSDKKSVGSLIKDKLTSFDLPYIGKMSFYLGVILEVFILALDKSSFINPYEGWMFRISFVLFAIKCCFTKYSKREYIAISLLGLVALASYLTNTRDEAIRILTFVVAMKDMDLKRVLKLIYKLSILSMGVIALLSILGVYGTIFDPSEGYGIKEGTYRLCFGLGNSNAFAIMIWALMTLGIYLYHDKMKNIHYVMLLALSLVTFIATYTRTTACVMVLTVAMSYVLNKYKALSENRGIYMLGALATVLFTVFSVWSAAVSDWHDFLSPFVYKLNSILTGRIEAISRFVNGGGIIQNWKLFGDPTYIEYFDMGYVRLFFWYGIIPGSVAILVLLLAIYECYRRKDYMSFMMIMMFALFTVVEAHIISVYIARNYLLCIIGAYLPSMIYLFKDRPREKDINREYWWKINRLLVKNVKSE